MGSITLTPLRDTAVDFSYPYFFTRLGFITKKPGPLPKFTAILGPYQKIVWLTISIAIPSFSLIYWTLSSIREGQRRKMLKFGAVIEEVSKMLVMQGMKRI